MVFAKCPVQINNKTIYYQKQHTMLLLRVLFSIMIVYFLPDFSIKLIILLFKLSA